MPFVSLEFWSKLAKEINPKVDKIGPRVPQGMPTTSVQGGTPPEVRKTARKKNALPWQRFTHMAPKWEPTSQNLELFGYWTHQWRINRTSIENKLKIHGTSMENQWDINGHMILWSYDPVIRGSNDPMI